jgi:hypothetical protein
MVNGYLRAAQHAELFAGYPPRRGSFLPSASRAKPMLRGSSPPEAASINPRCEQSKTAEASVVSAYGSLGRFAPHYQRDLVVLFCVFLGGVLLVLGSVQVMAVRDLRMMSGLFMIAGL